ncbi:hypothetical protein [Paraburkholderia caffeinilytica]|uniref:hypothetical protein n=1 Tax=Paraburkholderia caffeinilytica TaxID=1761016 RepID=UPI0038BC98B7
MTELTKEEIEAKLQMEWEAERMDEWARHAEKQADRLKEHLYTYRTLVWKNFPDMRKYYSGKLFREILNELRIAVDQIELLAQGKTLTHVLESKAVFVPLDDQPDETAEQPQDEQPLASTVTPGTKAG